MEKLTGARKSAYHITGPAVRIMARTGITPDNLSWLGFAIAVGAAVLIGYGHLFIAGFVVLAGGFFDMLDGALARYTGKVTSSGAVLDSMLDRFSEALLLLGVLFYYVFWGGWSGPGAMLAGLAMVASPLPSYIRAKAEANGIDCKIGIFTRPERIIVLAVGLLASYVSNSMYVALAVIAVFSFVTAGQRWLYVQKRLANGCGDRG